MNKEVLISDIKNGLSSLSGTFDEYNQFLCDEIYELLPYLNKEGLVYFKRQIKEVKECNGIE